MKFPKFLFENLQLIWEDNTLLSFIMQIMRGEVPREKLNPSWLPSAWGQLWNQSTCKRQAGENTFEQVTIGFGFTFDWLRKRGKIF